MEQPYVNLGSRSQPAATGFSGGLPRLRERWRHALGRHQGEFFGATAAAVVTCGFLERSNGDWYDPEAYRTDVLDPQTGALRARLAERIPLGLHAGALLCTDQTLSGLWLYTLESGALLHHHPRAGRGSYGNTCGLSTEQGVFLWSLGERESLRLWPGWPDPAFTGAPRSAGGAQPPLDPLAVGLPAGRIAYLRARGARLAVCLFDPGHLVVMEGGAAPRILWQRPWAGHDTPDLFLDDDGQGWLVRTQAALELYDQAGQRRARVAGARRCWASPAWIVGATEDDAPLFAVARGRADRRELPLRGAPWDVALAGDHAVLIERRPQVLRWHALDLRTGAHLWTQEQARLGAYGLSRWEAVGGRLYGVSDEGDVLCLEPGEPG